jgi:hypothetical protein
MVEPVRGVEIGVGVGEGVVRQMEPDLSSSRECPDDRQG